LALVTPVIERPETHDEIDHFEITTKPHEEMETTMKHHGRTGRRPTGIVTTLCVAALLLAACGDDDDDDAAATEPTTPASAAQSTAAVESTPATAAGSAPGATPAPAATAEDTATTGTAGGAAWDETIAAANGEGELEVWSVLNPTHNANVEAAFEAAFPDIDVTITQYGPPDIATRVDAEQDAGVGTVDVLLSTDRIWHAQHLADGYFQEITGPDVLAADELVRDGAEPTTDGVPIASQALYDDNTRLITSFGAWGYAWNTDAVESEPTFEQLFADDTYAGGRLGMNDPNTNPVNTVLFGKLNERYPGLFERLGELSPTLYPSSGPAAEALGAGAVDAILAISEAAAATAPTAGFAFDENFPALASPVYAEVLASSTTPRAAQVFTNWLMTTEGQEAWAAGYASVLPDISTASLSSADVEVLDAEAVDPAQRQQWLDELNAALGR
jgi:iron(III) transport system substrate-binding protein